MILVLGGTGATGRLVVSQLLDRDCRVRVVVRSKSLVPDQLRPNDCLEVVEGSVAEMSDASFAECLEGCKAVVSCLGHNLTMQGMFGRPRRLVADVAKRVCTAIDLLNSTEPVKFVLMNTAGNRNGDLDESISLGQSVVMGLLRTLVPPVADNEAAAEYLRTTIGQGNSRLEWVVVRPDTLVDDVDVTPYELHPSPTRSAIFNPGKTSRINVARFMVDVLSDDELWARWRGQMPVIYNSTPASS